MIYVGAAASFFPYPIYMYVFKNERVPLLSMYIPGIDETTVSGYLILICVQVPLMFMAIVGMTSCDIMYAMMLINIPILARLVEDEINEMNEMLEKMAVKVHIWKHRLRNLLVMHQEMTQYFNSNFSFSLPDIWFCIFFQIYFRIGGNLL